MKIYIGSDHAGFELKQKLIEYVKELSHEIEDKGPFEFDADDDYPDFVVGVAKRVVEDPEQSRGIVIGGSGQGEAMVCNRLKGVRAAVFYGPRQATYAVDISGKESSDPYEIVKLSREHNDANVLSLSARFMNEDEAKQAVKIFLDTKFSGEERHMRRINKIDSM